MRSVSDASLAIADYGSEQIPVDLRSPVCCSQYPGLRLTVAPLLSWPL